MVLSPSRILSSSSGPTDSSAANGDNHQILQQLGSGSENPFEVVENETSQLLIEGNADGDIVSQPSGREQLTTSSPATAKTEGGPP